MNYYIDPVSALDAFYERKDDDQCIQSNSLCLAVYKSQKLDADEDQRYYSLRVRVTVSLVTATPPH